MREPQVDTVMTRDVVVVHPDTPFKDVVERLTSRAFSAVPVVDGDGRVVGVVSEADLVAKQEHRGGTAPGPSLLDGRAARRRWRQAHDTAAGDVMSSPVRTTTPDEPVSAAARTLATAGVRRLFVADGGGRLVGVVSRRDLVGLFLRSDGDLRRTVERDVLERVLGLEPGAVEVEVAHGVVSLRGRVDRLSEAEIAVRVIRALPGVVGVTSTVTAAWDDTEPVRNVGITG